MFPRWWRLGIRPQITIIVIVAAVLSTVATLFIADNAIQNYVLQQASTQEQENMNIANLVLQTQYGQNISISVPTSQCPKGCMVADVPGTGKDFAGLGAKNSYGRYQLNGDTDYVDNVQQLIHGIVSVYQCADSHGNPTPPCVRIATTLRTGNSTSTTAPREDGVALTADATGSTNLFQDMHLDSTPREWEGEVTIDGQSYFADYKPILDPSRQLIGVIGVAVPLGVITTVVSRTTVELVLIGTIIMVAGVVLALFFASTVVATLQRAARQISGASERMGGIAAQQSSGSAQQVWAINAINQALQNFSETAKDISHRTDQLAQMGNQVLQRRQELSPSHIDSILAYITRSVRDISVASRQQASQYERMTGAMQAVIEIAEQVAGNSQQASESSERLELVTRQLQQLVGVRQLPRSTASETMGMESTPDLTPRAAGKPAGPRGTIRAVRPERKQAANTGAGAGGMAGAALSSTGNMGGMPGTAGMGQMPPMAGATGQSGRMSNMGGMMVMGGAGMMPGAAGMAGHGTHGAPNGMSGGMPPVGGPQSGGNGAPVPGMGATGGAQDYSFMAGDWRLPPMPEMALPNLDGGSVGQPGQAPRNGDGNGNGRASRMSGPGRPAPQPAPGRGWGAPAGDPYGGGMSNPNAGGWPVGGNGRE